MNAFTNTIEDFSTTKALIWLKNMINKHSEIMIAHSSLGPLYLEIMSKNLTYKGDLDSYSTTKALEIVRNSIRNDISIDDKQTIQNELFRTLLHTVFTNLFEKEIKMLMNGEEKVDRFLILNMLDDIEFELKDSANFSNYHSTFRNIRKNNSL